MEISSDHGRGGVSSDGCGNLYRTINALGTDIITCGRNGAIIMIIKPMLAWALGKKQGKKLRTVKQDLSELIFPQLVSDKEDGIRGYKPYDLISRSGKPIPNNHIRNTIERYCPAGLDGEIVTYTEGVRDPFNIVSGKVMGNKFPKPDFKWHVFDYCTNPNYAFVDRVFMLQHLKGLPDFVEKVPSIRINNLDELCIHEHDAVEIRGIEGLCGRILEAPYKYGRATFREQWLWKWTRWVRAEARITGFVEMRHNTNEAFTGELGQTKRSRKAEGMVPKGTLACFQMKMIEEPFWEFEVAGGYGMDDTFRKYVWEHKGEFLDQIATFRYKDYGVVEAPRSPQWVSLRSVEDMGE